jgi:hypothetical protein
MGQANETLARLEAVCKRITHTVAEGGWTAGCKEWQELKAALDTSGAAVSSHCLLE